MKGDRTFEIAVRTEWMRGDVSLLEVLVADGRLVRNAESLAQEREPAEAARLLVDQIPRWVRRVGRGLEAIGLPLALLALVTWLQDEVADHPGHLGLWGLLAIIGVWILGEVLYLRGKAVWLFGAFVFGAGFPVLVALEWPGPDIGVPLPPLWPAVVAGALGGAAYLYRLIRAAPEPAAGLPMLQHLWRLGGARESAIGEMTEEVEALAAAREEGGRPLTHAEWFDEGLTVEWPDAVDPRRLSRLMWFALAAGVFFTCLFVLAEAVGARSWTAALGGDQLRIGAGVMAVVAVPSTVLVRRGRWLVAILALIGAATALILPGDVVVIELHVVWVVVALMWSGWMTWRRRPRSIREVLDRLL